MAMVGSVMDDVALLKKMARTKKVDTAELIEGKARYMCMLMPSSDLQRAPTTMALQATSSGWT